MQLSPSPPQVISAIAIANIHAFALPIRGQNGNRISLQAVGALSPNSSSSRLQVISPVDAE